MLRSELATYMDTDILTMLHVSFSKYHGNGDTSDGRGNKEETRYVQDSIRRHWQQFSEWVLNQESYVYVCGYITHTHTCVCTYIAR